MALRIDEHRVERRHAALVRSDRRGAVAHPVARRQVGPGAVVRRRRELIGRRIVRRGPDRRRLRGLEGRRRNAAGQDQARGQEEMTHRSRACALATPSVLDERNMRPASAPAAGRLDDDAPGRGRRRRAGPRQRGSATRCRRTWESNHRATPTLTVTCLHDPMVTSRVVPLDTARSRRAWQRRGSNAGTLKIVRRRFLGQLRPQGQRLPRSGHQAANAASSSD